MKKDFDIELFIRQMRRFNKKKKSFIGYLKGYRSYYIKLDGLCKSSWPFRNDEL